MSVRKRIPGPAGLLGLNSGKRQRVQGKKADDSEGDHEAASPFLKGPWLAMCEKYNVEAPRHHPSLESSLNVFQPGLGSGVLETTAQDLGGARQFKRIAKYTGVIEEIRPWDGDALLHLADPTGKVKASVHRTVIDEYGARIAVGAVLVLSKVVVISPQVGVALLNVTKDNVMDVIDADTIGPLNLSFPPTDPSNDAASVASRSAAKEPVLLGSQQSLRFSQALAMDEDEDEE